MSQLSAPQAIPPVARRRSARVTAALVCLAVGGGLIAAVPSTAIAAVPSAATVPSTATAAVTDLPTSFVSTSSSWKYSDNNTDPAAGNTDRLSWTTSEFDDSTWKDGVGAFGAKNGSATPSLGTSFPVTTVLNQYIDATAASKVDVPTFHFRSDFSISVDQIDEIAGLTGSITYDDAVQIFVNGTKVAGFLDERVEAVADAQKNLTYAGSSGGDPVSSTFTVPAAVLHTGTNTISIALYQDRSTSSDAYLDLTSLAPIEQAAASTTISDVVLGVGSSESERIPTWYSSADTAQSVQFAPAAEMTGTEFPATATTIAATGGATTSGEFNRTATITGLAENTAYVYRVGSASGWSSSYSFRTQSFDGDFDFLFFGDPQIGSSGNVQGDADGWTDTVNVATATYPDAELLFSAGDQVESAANETQYAAFLQPEQLRQTAFVATNGNHDVGSKAYQQHFTTPNTDLTAGAGSTTSSGGDYWFIYKDVLFMNLNSNSLDYTSHIAWMQQVVADHGDEAQWKVLAFHHSIYSTGPHATDTDTVSRRSTLPTVISDLGVDLVLQGHDHSYARSYLIRNGEIADDTEEAGADSVVAGPGGVLYVTANSASGSKYYDASNSASWWLSASNQEKVRNYTAVEVTENAITIKTLRSQANGATLPVNSVVDQVTLSREVEPDVDAQQLQVTVPEVTAGEFVWSIDGTNGLVDLGTATDKGDNFTATGSINPIRVTDTRSAGPEWSISAQVGDFTASDTSFSGKYLGWTPTLVESGADAMAGAAVASGFDGGDGLAASSTLGNASAGHSRGSATLGADLYLKIPVDVANGTYRATLTLTALS